MNTCIREGALTAYFREKRRKDDTLVKLGAPGQRGTSPSEQAEAAWVVS